MIMLDRDISDFLGSPPPLPSLTPEVIALVRAGMREAGAALPAPEVDLVQDFDANGVPVLLYRPIAAEPLPLLVFLHGGGWLLGDLDTHDAMLRLLCERAGCAVLGVGYRLAPEHRFPAALDDVETAWQWACETVAELNCDATRLAIGGESAGANLAAALTLRLQTDRQDQPCFQLLVHPATDLRLGLPSFDEVQAPGLDRAYLEQCVAMYLGDAEPTDPLASPLLAASHEGLPPAIVITAEEDPLRDDGEFYARALADAGVETIYRRLPGLPHGFMFLPVTIPAVSKAFDTIAALVRHRFAAEQ